MLYSSMDNGTMYLPSGGVFCKCHKGLASVVSLLLDPRHEISSNVVCATSKGSDQPAHTRSLI